MWIIVWLVLSVLVAVFASNKGKSSLLYFLISLILSPLLGFLIVLVSKDETKIKCSNCGELIDKNAKICPFCSDKKISKDGEKENIKAPLSKNKKYTFINKKFRNDTYLIDIDECEISDFEKIKGEILEQYKALEYNEIKMDKKDMFMLKSSVHKRSYINIKFKNQIVSIEAYNVNVPPIMYNSKQEFNQENNNEDSISKLIELSKLVEKGLLTKEEFELEKKKLLNN